MKKMLVIFAMLFCSAFAFAAYPDSVITKADLTQLTLQYQGTPQGFVDTLKGACKNATGYESETITTYPIWTCTDRDAGLCEITGTTTLKTVKNTIFKTWGNIAATSNVAECSMNYTYYKDEVKTGTYKEKLWTVSGINLTRPQYTYSQVTYFRNQAGLIFPLV